MQPGASSFLDFSLERTKQRHHHGDGTAGVLEQKGVAKVQGLHRRGSSADLLTQGGIRTFCRRGPLLVCRGSLLPGKGGKVIAEGLLLREAVFQLSDVVGDDRVHGSLQLMGEQVQKLQMFCRLAIPD